MDDVWWGARNGGVRTRPLDGRRRPPAEWAIVVASACSRSSGGQQAGQALGEHRLAAARRADEQQVVAAGRRHLQGVAGAPAGRGRRRGRPIASATGGWDGSTWSHARAPTRHSTTARRSGAVWAAPHAATCASTMLSGAVTTSACPSASTIGATPGTGRSAPSRPSSARKANRATRLERHLTVGGEHADGDGQVEPGARLAHAARREVDHDRLVGPRQLARHHRGAHPVARLAADRVGQPDQPIAGKAAPADVHLDAHRAAVDAEQRGR